MLDSIPSTLYINFIKDASDHKFKSTMKSMIKKVTFADEKGFSLISVKKIDSIDDFGLLHCGFDS